MGQKTNMKKSILNIIPILLMIGLIPLIQNDYLLTTVYIIISVIAFAIKYEKKEYAFYLLGFFGMIVSEYIFISTKVETFNRVSLLGVMPLWLPFLWAYGFVVMKRVIKIIE